MKKLLFLFGLALIISCSSDNSSSSAGESDGSATINGTTYNFNRAYLTRSGSDGSWGHHIILTDGSISSDSGYSADTTNRMVFHIQDENSPELRNFNYIYNDSAINLNGCNFMADIVIQNSEISSSNTLFVESDIIGEQGRITVSNYNGSTGSFSFNFVTSAGQINGHFSGTVTKLNY